MGIMPSFGKTPVVAEVMLVARRAVATFRCADEAHERTLSLDQSGLRKMSPAEMRIRFGEISDPDERICWHWPSEVSGMVIEEFPQSDEAPAMIIHYLFDSNSDPVIMFSPAQIREGRFDMALSAMEHGNTPVLRLGKTLQMSF